LKQGDALSALVFNCPLECVIRRVQDGLKLNDTRQILFYAGVNMSVLVESIHTRKTDTEGLLVASMETGLEVDAEKT
jgi:hypothetical protein